MTVHDSSMAVEVVQVSHAASTSDTQYCVCLGPCVSYCMPKICTVQGHNFYVLFRK